MSWESSIQYERIINELVRDRLGGTASADLLIESIIGKPVEDVKNLSRQDVLDMLGIELGPVRLKCALLPLKVLKAGVYGLGEASDELTN